MEPAERVELVVDFRDYAPGSELVLRNDGGEETTGAVMRFDVVRGGGSEDFRVPRRLRQLERAPRAQRPAPLGAHARASAAVADQRPRLRPGPDRRAAAPRHTESWQYMNPSNRVHPMHLHGILFRMLERSTGRVHPADRGWKDTIGVKAGETVSIQPWFAPYPGRYVFHCHKLEHGDKAMMLQLEVVR